MKKILLSAQKCADIRMYLQALSPFGSVRPAGESADGDVLVLGGGGDLSPRYAKYAGDPVRVQIEDEERDRLELALLRHFAAAGKPVLGICRGAQMIAAAFGGTLCADLGTDTHRKHMHGVKVLPCSRLYAVLGEHTLVNSFHHQAVLRPGRALYIAARAPDGVCEAIEHRFLPIFGVQWHPERMAEENMRALFARFL